MPIASMNSTAASAKSDISACGTPSGSDRPKPGVSGAITVNWSLQRCIVASMSREDSGLWWKQITTGPEPARR